MLLLLNGPPVPAACAGKQRYIMTQGLARYSMEGCFLQSSACVLPVQVRRSRAWFPCLDVPLAACPFDLHFTVSANQLAVSCGKLMKQTLVDRGKRRCFHYKLAIPAPPHDIAFAIGNSLSAASLACCLLSALPSVLVIRDCVT